MLTKSNDRALAYKIVNDELVFFYQRWQEFLDYRTLDTYQYNILNTCVACNELVDVIDKTLEGQLVSRQNIDDVKDEVLYILKHDDILELYNKNLKITLLRIVSSRIESKQKSDSHVDMGSRFYISLRKLRYRLKTPVRLMSCTYLPNILKAIKQDIDSHDEIQMEKHMNSLISQCIHEGWSRRGLFLLSRLFEDNLSLGEKWSSFSTRILHGKSDYQVYYRISIETRKELPTASIIEIIRSLEMKIVRGSDVIAKKSESQRNLYTKLHADKYYIEEILSATDFNSAALTAINNLNKKLSIATFYNAISPAIPDSSQIIINNTITAECNIFSISDIFKTYDYIDSTNNIFQYTKDIYNCPDKSHIMNRLHAAFSYTNLSRTSLFQETKFISLWIALESVMRTGLYPDIISHIKCVLPETLSLRYMYRIIRNFSEDCIRCGFISDGVLCINMKSKNKSKLVEDLIQIFRATSSYTILAERCKENSLLLYRCREIHSLFTDTQSLIHKLERHVTKIKWHIQRLYRIRNEITHSAFHKDVSLTIYIENLYTYLAQLISETVYFIENRNVQSIEEAYEVIVDNYHTFMEIMARSI